mgnify:FL=1
MSPPHDTPCSICNEHDGCDECTNCSHAICLSDQCVHIIQGETHHSYLCSDCYENISNRFRPLCSNNASHNNTPDITPNRSRSPSYDDNDVSLQQPLLEEQYQQRLLFNLLLEIQQQWQNDPDRCYRVSSELLQRFEHYNDISLDTLNSTNYSLIVDQ